jgi:hypothetical protein
MTVDTEEIRDHIIRVLDGGRMALGEFRPRFMWVGDWRWVLLSFDVLAERGVVRYVNCHLNHDHDGGCVIEAVAQ